MKNEFCEFSPDQYHKAVILAERTQDHGRYGVFQQKRVGCEFCREIVEITFDLEEKPADHNEYKKFAYLFARDFIQPNHPHYERLNGKEAKEYIVKESKKNREKIKEVDDMKLGIEDFKEHHTHGKKQF